MEKAFEDCSVGPVLLSVAVLLVAGPLSSAENSVEMPKLAKPVGFAELPVSVVVVSVWVDVDSHLLKVVVGEVPVVVSSTAEKQLTEALDSLDAVPAADMSPQIAHFSLLTLAGQQVQLLELHLIY